MTSSSSIHLLPGGTFIPSKIFPLEGSVSAMVMLPFVYLDPTQIGFIVSASTTLVAIIVKNVVNSTTKNHGDQGTMASNVKNATVMAIPQSVCIMPQWMQ